MIDTDTMNRMLVEIVTGKKPARDDTVEEAKMRIRLKRECEEIQARGGVVEIPAEHPDLS